MGTRSNFKTAVNELMAGKFTSGAESFDENLEEGYPQEDKVQAAGPAGQPGSRSGVYSVIAEGTIIEGSVYGDSSIQINGRIKGDVTTTKDIISKGIIEGNVKAANITLSHSSVKGSISASGTLSIDGTSIAVGNIDAANLEVSGRVKGDIKVKDAAVLKRSALILGNVVSKTVSVEAGAGLKGELDIFSVPIHDKDFNVQSFSDPAVDSRAEKETDDEPAFLTKLGKQADLEEND